MREDYVGYPSGYCCELFSNIKVAPEQIAWLLNQFGALQERSREDWTIELGPGVTDVVSVADGTSDLSSTPRQILDDAARWLGGPRNTALPW